MGKIYGSARVSTRRQAKDGNSLDSQEQQLRDNGAAEIYADSFTGTKIDRPELDKLLNVLQEGDTLIVTKLDRIARSMSQGLINKTCGNSECCHTYKGVAALLHINYTK